jgi:fatty acid desaturase
VISDESSEHGSIREERQALRRELSARWSRQLRGASLFAGALTAVVGGGVLFRVSESYWMPLCGAIGLAGLVFSLSNWKCPACAQRLSTRARQASCPGCGLPLE